MRFVAFLGLVFVTAGCHSESFDVTDGESRLVEAKHRAVLSVKRSVIGSEGQLVLDDEGDPVESVSVCAEPSPDALKSSALELGGKASKEGVDAALEAVFKRSETQQYVGLRTQTIQLLRDAYFRLCEAFMNDGIDAIAYDVLQRRFQSQIIALLAVEQLTGAAVAGQQATAEIGATEVARIAGSLEESEKILRDLRKERDQAQKYLDELKNKEVPKKDEKEHVEAVSIAHQALEAAENQVKRRRQVADLLNGSFIRATQAAEDGDVRGPVESAARAGGVADAVRAITLNAINQDYESQVCFETLRYHNHVGQFRNDVNNAFDSIGVPTSLPEGVFLDHCRELFALQADFRNARVGAAEALTIAVGQVTKKLVDNELSAKGAALYIRALAESVQLVPGVAFLHQDSKDGRETEKVEGPGLAGDSGE